MFVSSILFTAASLSLAAPQLPDGMSVEMLSDYPTWALREEQSTFVYYELFVDPQGNVLRCEIVASAGSERLAKHVCSMQRRAKVIPAVNADGEAAFGKRRDVVKMVLPDTELGQELSSLQANAQYQLAVKSLAPGDGNRKEIALAIQVMSDGSVGACAEKMVMNRPTLKQPALFSGMSHLRWKPGKTAIPFHT